MLRRVSWVIGNLMLSLPHGLLRGGLLDLAAIPGHVLGNLNERKRAGELLLRFLVVPDLEERNGVVITEIFLPFRENPQSLERRRRVAERTGAIKADRRFGDHFARRGLAVRDAYQDRVGGVEVSFVRQGVGLTKAGQECAPSVRGGLGDLRRSRSLGSGTFGGDARLGFALRVCLRRRHAFFGFLLRRGDARGRISFEHGQSFLRLVLQRGNALLGLALRGGNSLLCVGGGGSGLLVSFGLRG